MQAAYPFVPVAPPAVEYVPAGHKPEHAEVGWLVANGSHHVPAGQAVHVLDVPCPAVEYEPGLHGKQEDVVPRPRRE